MSDLPLALRRLKKFNDFVAHNESLDRLLISGEYNFLQAYQSNILSDIAAFAEKEGSRPGEGGYQEAGLAVRLDQLFAIIFSLGSLLLLAISDRKILIYSADKDTAPRYECDFRVFNLYRYLIERRLSFVEILHVIFRKGMIRIALRRRRSVIYLEAIDVVYKFLLSSRLIKNSIRSLYDSIDFGTGQDAILFRMLVKKYVDMVGVSQFRIRILSGVLKWTSIKVLLASVDARNYNELIAACNRVGIKTHVFQSGNLSKYDVGYLSCCDKGTVIKPTKFFVETGYWKHELLRLGTYLNKDEIEIGGNIKEDYVAPVPQMNVLDPYSLTILIPYETIAPKGEIISYVTKLLTYPEITVVFKFRADRDLKRQAREYGLSETLTNLRLVTTLDEVDKFDIVAGTYSTFLYEMVGVCKPVAYLNTSLDYGEGLLINGLADKVSLDDPDLLGKLKKIKHTSEEVLTKRRQKLYGDTVPLSKTLDTILAAIAR